MSESVTVPRRFADGYENGVWLEDPKLLNDLATARLTAVADEPATRWSGRKAREEAGVGIGLADDLQAIRTALVKAHLAGDFEAVFDLVVYSAALRRRPAMRVCSMPALTSVLDASKPLIQAPVSRATVRAAPPRPAPISRTDFDRSSPKDRTNSSTLAALPGV